MRAFAVQSFGQEPAILQLPTPDAKDTIVIRVADAGVNPLDYKLLERLTASSNYPFVMGIDFSGVVEQVPTGVADFEVGDRIFGRAGTRGSYAEYTAVIPGAKGEPLAHTPDEVTDEQAAALPTSGVTALGALELLGVAVGQYLVVMGATGGVGGYAVQMARSRGVHVIATVRGEVDEARNLGAEAAYDVTSVDFVEAIRKGYPDGVDAVLDLVNDSDLIRRDAEILKSGGSLVSTIFAADPDWFTTHNITAHNHASSTNPYVSSEGLIQVAQMLAEGDITTRIGSTFGLDGAPKMLEDLRKGRLRGKAVLHVS
jgi:NADPH:quinone reductase-like Zn-dependent oxidoreductase